VQEIASLPMTLGFRVKFVQSESFEVIDAIFLSQRIDLGM
jgi:hypothetical protein